MLESPKPAALPPRIDNPPADLMAHLKGQYKQLSRSDRKIARRLMDVPEQFVSASVKEVANDSEVSEATVVRFARNLGCAGFKELKILLAKHLAVSQALKDARHNSPAVAKDSPVDQICSAAIAALGQAARGVNPDDMEEAAAAIASAKRLFIYGIGGSSAILAAEAHNRLFRLNIPCTTYTDSYMQRMSASTLTPGDVGLFISSTGRPRSLLESVELAQYYGARCIAIADEDSALARQSDIYLNLNLSQSGVSHDQPNPMRFAQLSIIDGLAYRVATLLGDRADTLLKRVRTSVASLHGIVPQQPIGD